MQTIFTEMLGKVERSGIVLKGYFKVKGNGDKENSTFYPLVFTILLGVGRVSTDLLIVFLKCGKIFASLRKFTLKKKLFKTNSHFVQLSSKHTSSIPSPTYQCTKARLEYIRSNL
jgi:hypothetical protein